MNRLATDSDEEFQGPGFQPSADTGGGILCDDFGRSPRQVIKKMRRVANFRTAMTDFATSPSGERNSRDAAGPGGASTRARSSGIFGARAASARMVVWCKIMVSSPRKIISSPSGCSVPDPMRDSRRWCTELTPAKRRATRSAARGSGWGSVVAGAHRVSRATCLGHGLRHSRGPLPAGSLEVQPD
jgi:hypothetical protein